METDEVIQKTIREQFHNSTVITIAHRLNTIVDYDMIVLMSDGRIKQVGKPSEVLQLMDSPTNSSPNLPSLSTAPSDSTASSSSSHNMMPIKESLI
ncbi:hypothetical protein SAMD00019534_002290 [Acytostelium subglobosum LB1]|uniref:hypothetical protein n=1 Tax=Acytostelium subglobosum LB1 TaxID=1410327 RepID=UPI000644B3D9|nr:hypothetical protein SAMD00019534_002290 [Acytostelium subglobosum LB1]GAM17054.1 hypothetical protein SAMD00019534_002290 [Acytostelium subglobosum LB1]|eukprot:XP_012759116.1 hypothetical protein SAMD00019534_002290 [Acytostelium subglobosum LB1]